MNVKDLIYIFLLSFNLLTLLTVFEILLKAVSIFYEIEPNAYRFVLLFIQNEFSLILLFFFVKT